MRIALVHLGMDDSYGMYFVAGELKKSDVNFEWFDGDSDEVIAKIIDYSPNFMFFGPLTLYFSRALDISKGVKKLNKKVVAVFGGHHVSVDHAAINREEVDIIVDGPIYNTIEKIFISKGNEIIHGTPVLPGKMRPSRVECYNTISRLANRHQKTIMSFMGCPFNCSYCSTGHVRSKVGAKTYKEYWLKRRPLKDVIREAKELIPFPTKEISLADDDILAGPDAAEWLKEFSCIWKKEIDLPIIAYVTPSSISRASDEVLKILGELLHTALIGVQVARSDSLKLFNRTWQTEKTLVKASENLTKAGLQVRVDIMIGLPVDDPIEEGVETIKLIQRVFPKCNVSTGPLMIYPGTDIFNWCKENKIPLNENVNLDFHKGLGSIKFDLEVQKQLTNLKKMSSMFVEYGIEDHWMRALIRMDMNNGSSLDISKCCYYDSIKKRHQDMQWDDFNKIVEGMEFQH